MALKVLVMLDVLAVKRSSKPWGLLSEVGQFLTGDRALALKF